MVSTSLEAWLKIMVAEKTNEVIMLIPPITTKSRFIFCMCWIAVDIAVICVLAAMSIWYLINADLYSTIFFANAAAIVSITSTLVRSVVMGTLESPNCHN